MFRNNRTRPAALARAGLRGPDGGALGSTWPAWSFSPDDYRDLSTREGYQFEIYCRVLAPAASPVLRVPFAQISGVAEAEPFAVRITVTGGTVIGLSRPGVMRRQLLAGLRDGRGDDTAP